MLQPVIRHKNMKHHMSAVSKVRKYFPKVTKVVDSNESVTVSVNKSDVKSGRRNEPGSCALAKACIREFRADGALINIGFSYVIRGKTAVRFKTSNTVAREIVSFDRHSDFAPGKDYRLQKVSPANRLGSRSPKPTGPKKSKSTQQKPILHRTVRIRKATR
jgi:hypothetical protein